jgi:predicted nucleotidyltransferase
MKLDVMPIEEKILGFTNRWYKPAMNAATERELEEGLRIRVVTPPYFIATKLEAFRGRGKNDYANSHDLEDLLTVIDGRDVIGGEIAETAAVREYIAREFRALLETPALLDALPGYLLSDSASQERLPILKARITQISSL